MKIKSRGDKKVTFVLVCKKTCLKVNADKSKVVTLGGKEFKYLGFVLDESDTDGMEGKSCSLQV